MVKHSDTAISTAVQHSTSWREVTICLGIGRSGSSQTWIKRRAIKAGIDFAHFPGQRSRLGKSPTNRRPAQNILVKTPYDSRPTSSYLLRRALLEIGRIEECSTCKAPPHWQGKPLKIEIDHINGDKWDNEPGNLRFLCPNCHTQEPTSSHSRRTPATLWSQRQKQTKDEQRAKQREYRRAQTHPCIQCGVPAKGQRCRRCAGFKRGTHTQRVVWPSDEELIRLITERSPFAVAKDLGVSDNAIRHRLERRGYKVTRGGVTRNNE